MKYIAVSVQGLEQIAIDEINSLIKAKTEIIHPGRILVEIEENSRKQPGRLGERRATTIQTLIYNTRSLIYIYQFIDQAKIKTLENIKALAKKIDFKALIKETFLVRCERNGTHSFNSLDVEKGIGTIIHEKYKIPVNLNNPITTIYADINEENCIIGIDLVGYKLSKRDYRIKIISSSINACVAFSLIKFANWKEKESLLDPFTKTGEICIEAAMFALNVSPQKHLKDKLLITKLKKCNFKDKEKTAKVNLTAADEIMSNIRNTEINSKLAGVNKSLKFSRLETKWLDSKFKKNSIDKIITFPPQISQTHTAESIEQIYHDLFYNAEYILKKSGSIVLLMNRNLELLNRYSTEFNFKITKTLEFEHGNQKYVFIELKK